MSPWDNISFVSKSEVICGAIGCVNCLTSSLHQIGTTLYVSMLETINTTLVSDPVVKRLG